MYRDIVWKIVYHKDAKKESKKGTEMQGILENNPKIPSNFVCEKIGIFVQQLQTEKTKDIYGMDESGFLLFSEREEKSIDYCIELYCFHRIGCVVVLVQDAG